MKTLHCFGDSYTQGHKNNDGYPPYIEWEKYRGGNLPDTWSELLSRKLDMKLLNGAIAGSSNHEIFHSICQECNKFKKGDIVIINWTYMHRFRWAIEVNENIYIKNRWKRSSICKKNPCEIDEPPTDEIREAIAINRTNPLYIDEIYEYEKIIDILSESVGFDVYYWTSENTLIHNLPYNLLHQKKYILHNLIKGNEYRGLLTTILNNGGNLIVDETNSKVQDAHLGEIGHKIQCDLFYNYITNPPIIILEPIKEAEPKKLI